MIVGGGIEGRLRQARRWRTAFGVLLVATIAELIVNLVGFELRSGNWWGMGYGIAAAALMIAAMLLGVRRRTMKAATALRLGRARAWLHLHIYGGLLALLLTLMHAEFRLPVGTIATWLYWLSVITVLTGLIGLALQKWIPRALSSGLSTEVLYERIPSLVDEIRGRAVALVEADGVSVKLRDFYEARIDEQLQKPQRNPIYFIDVSGSSRSQSNEFTYLRPFLPEAEQETLDELERLYRGKLEVDAHYTLQYVLRSWHYLHVPLSILLMGFLIIHVLSVYLW